MFYTHGVEECAVDSAYCPIDIYVQRCSPERMNKREVFDHYIAVDIIAPCMAHTTAARRQCMKYQGESIHEGYYV